MKENIEEDIKVAKKLIETMEQDKNTFKDEQSKEIYAYFINALEHILSDYKRVLKENEELKHKYDKALSDVIAGVDLDNTYIPKQKIKDKIEELEEKRIKMEKEDIGVGFTLGEEWSDLKSKIKAYKDLLEEKGE